jgi:hypothetical protein
LFQYLHSKYLIKVISHKENSSIHLLNHLSRFNSICLLAVLYVQTALLGQDPGYENHDKVMHIRKTYEQITLDGVLDEPVWQSVEKYSDFWMKFPNNDTKGNPPTYVQVTYDDKFLYFGITVIETPGGNIVQSLKRDMGLRAGDGIGIVLDPFNLKANGFYFAVSPYNSQTEGLIGNSLDEITFTWDHTWYSETRLYDGYWTAEIAIPFSVLRFEDKGKIWGVNFIRAARENNEFHTWTRIPLQFPGTDIGYAGKLIWDAPPPNYGSGISVNPYILSGLNADPENNKNTRAAFNAGADAKIPLSSSLNLDLTVNPDFSNVDVDEQVTNLTRFSIFFPERRVFFLENEDLFSGFGIPPVRPFYSRRIGSKDGQAVPILFGARLTGNLSNNFRFGAMNIQTARSGNLAPDNFTTVTFNQRVLDRSLIKGYFINRTSIQTLEEQLADPLGAFGRNAGLELNYISKAGDIQGWFSGNASFKPGISDQNLFSSQGGGYFGKNFSSFIDYVHIGKNYYADVGFVNRIENFDAARDTTIRIGQNFFYNESSYTWWYKDKKFNRIRLGSDNFIAFNQNFEFNESNIRPYLSLEWANTSSIRLGYNFNDVDLYFPFSFVTGDAEPLPAQRYRFDDVSIEFNTDRRKNFMFLAGGNYGKFYNADFLRIVSSFIVRNQPYFSLIMAFEYNKLDFPANFGRQEFFLVAPQIEVNFSNNLFWTSFLQWNSQADNFNINSRLQWRYTAMSDLFIVYTDNYFTETAFLNKNRAVVFKLNYWLNI